MGLNFKLLITSSVKSPKSCAMLVKYKAGHVDV